MSEKKLYTLMTTYILNGTHIGHTREIHYGEVPANTIQTFPTFEAFKAYAAPLVHKKFLLGKYFTNDQVYIQIPSGAHIKQDKFETFTIATSTSVALRELLTVGDLINLPLKEFEEMIKDLQGENKNG